MIKFKPEVITPITKTEKQDHVIVRHTSMKNPPTSESSVARNTPNHLADTLISLKYTLTLLFVKVSQVKPATTDISP